MCRHYGTFEESLATVDKLARAKEKVQMKDTINAYFAFARKETKSFLLESVWVDLNFTSMAKAIVTE
jgi:hypothetical protein